MPLINFIYTSNKELWVSKQKNRLSENSESLFYATSSFLAFTFQGSG